MVFFDFAEFSSSCPCEDSDGYSQWEWFLARVRGWSFGSFVTWQTSIGAVSVQGHSCII